MEADAARGMSWLNKGGFGRCPFEPFTLQVDPVIREVHPHHLPGSVLSSALPN